MCMSMFSKLQNRAFFFKSESGLTILSYNLSINAGRQINVMGIPPKEWVCFLIAKSTYFNTFLKLPTVHQIPIWEIL